VRESDGKSDAEVGPAAARAHPSMPRRPAGRCGSVCDRPRS